MSHSRQVKKKIKRFGVGGNPKIGEKSLEDRRQHIQDVYDAIYILHKKVKVKQIFDYLKFQEKTITKRTIQRCIREDRRIKKDGWYYFIDDVTRFERRYSSPSKFGERLFIVFINKVITELDSKLHDPNLLQLLENSVKEMIRRFGVFMFLTFIEATKPFKDKSMNFRDREDFVKYWAQNAIPISQMLWEFQYMSILIQGAFDQMAKRDKTYKYVHKTSFNEIDETLISKMYTILEKNYPDLYHQFNDLMERDLIQGKSQEHKEVISS